MHKNFNFYNEFPKKMLLISVLVGIFVATVMPTMYFLYSLEQKKEEAQHHGGRFEKKIEEQIKKDPRLWQYNLQKFMKVFSESELFLMTEIEVYNNKEELIYYQEVRESSAFTIKTKTNIHYNNQQFGYIIIKEKPGELVAETIILYLVSIILGIFVAYFLYKFPVNKVRAAEKSVKSYIEKLNHLSYYDQLTNLRNRTFFYEYLAEYIMETKKEFALIFIDLDRFKQVNDSLGHSFGDLILVEVAKRLQRLVGTNGTVTRFGGDEFTIILEKMDALDDLLANMLQCIDEPFVVGVHELYLTGSIGISIYPKDGEDIETLMRNADTAMFQAKRGGKNKHIYYTSTMNKESLECLKMENDLRRAIEKDELFLQYQPKVDSHTGYIKGMEALIRWEHSKIGIIPPNKFIPMAEETGLILTIGDWVLKEACRQNKEWQDKGMPKVPISVNLSVKQFQQRDLISDIKEALNYSGLEPQYLELEITESVAIEDEKLALEKIAAIKKLGIKIAIDDFGTGYSSLKYLKLLPIDTLKIDKTFIDKVPEDIYDAMLVKSIVNIAHSIGAEVVAEGVESIDILNFLRENKCDQYQGYYMSPPLIASEFERIWHENIA